MADRYLHLTRTAPGRFLTRRLGLPAPAELRRWSPGFPSLDGPLLHLTAGAPGHREDLAALLGRTGLAVTAGSPRPAAVVLDATGVAAPGELAEVHAALHPVVRGVAPGGRIVLLGAPLSAEDHHQAAAQQALEGFARSLGKEAGRGITVNLVRLTRPGPAESTLRFLLSPKSAYVSGQVVEVGPGEGGFAFPERPLEGRTALVTGAARGIGAAVAATLARDGAEVVCLDVPGLADELARTAEGFGGTALPLDITAPDAAERIAAAVAAAPGGAGRADGSPGGTVGTAGEGGASEAAGTRGTDGSGGLDVLVHNAGITRDRKLVNMPADRWSSVLDVNLGAVVDTTDALLRSGTLRRGSTVIATASIAGLAGNAGQTNYAASKAGIVGLVRSLAPRAAAGHGVTVNAVAPGFIETGMTAAVPLLIREAGRRMNSLAQGGLPADVAETTAWLAHPASAAVNGQVVRVCGQSLLGA
ncbi:3-oxoacyl-ACP reductase [Streptomyces sp. LP05-1]|uniref:3-oxoacyl-ACP reductase n=1 Tax=Streptomyces pyxinae TaxID=2970734 RepID=A0ABT2CPP2_9ACTN|nr:3-oxoacyl-ACP reductase [Streptomyces sp. LP05-1]MCS0639417.1 3-oxoacyl-ACP reductase [Streptomyces sp. LP05-1]